MEDELYEEEPTESLEEPLAEEPDEDLSNEEDMELDAALNTALPMSERRAALRNAIQLCVQREMGGGYDKEKEEGGDDMLSSLLGGA